MLEEYLKPVFFRVLEVCYYIAIFLHFCQILAMFDDFPNWRTLKIIKMTKISKKETTLFSTIPCTQKWYCWVPNPSLKNI